MLKQALACVQSRQKLHYSHTCTKWAYIQHPISVNAQTRLSMHTVSTEPLLLAHWQNGCRQRIRPKSVHVYRSNLYIYDKYQNCMGWLKYTTCFNGMLTSEPLVSYFISFCRNSCHPTSHLGQNLFICPTFDGQILHF